MVLTENGLVWLISERNTGRRKLTGEGSGPGKGRVWEHGEEEAEAGAVAPKAVTRGGSLRDRTFSAPGVITRQVPTHGAAGAKW